MPNIIDQIIQIDSIAQKRLDEAYRLREQLAREAEEQKAGRRADIEQKTKSQLDAIRDGERQNAEAQKAALQRKNEAALLRLEQLYAERHEALEAALFQNVVGG